MKNSFIKMNSSILKNLCLVFCILLCINCFAAIVSDNDSSAFLTQSEFDVYKKDFANQINNYNNGIDEKIDGAIQSYLANMKLQKVYQLEPCQSVLSYPLTFAMQNRTLDWSKWSVNGATPYWAPNYKTYIWGARATANFLINKEFATDTINNTFYNGQWVNDKYKVENMMKNVNGMITIKSCFYNLPTLQYSNETYVTFGFVLDQSSTYSRQGRGTGWNTRDLVRPSGNSLVDFYSGSSSYDSIKVDAIWSWGSNAALSIQSSSTSNEHYLNQYKAAAGGYTEGNNPGNITCNSSLYYTSSKVDFIMNAYDIDRTDATGKRIELPVAYNTHIYLTNKNNFKKDLQGGTSINSTYWNGYKIYNGVTETEWNNKAKYTTTWKFGNMISPGWTLEPQFSGYSSHSENQRSLLEPHRMYYEVKTPYTKTDKEQIMSNGILLTEADQELKTLEIKFDLSSENTAEKKYLVLSRQPIEQTDRTQIATEAAADVNKYYSISADSFMTSPTYTYELSEGVNKVYISDLKKNDLVYYKILWTTTDVTQATITTEPELKATNE